MTVAASCEMQHPHHELSGAQMLKRINPIDKYVGNRVRMRRLMLNMSQTELAAALGLAFQQVQKYENGTNRISASRLRADRAGAVGRARDGCGSDHARNHYPVAGA